MRHGQQVADLVHAVVVLHQRQALLQQQRVCHVRVPHARLARAPAGVARARQRRDGRGPAGHLLARALAAGVAGAGQAPGVGRVGEVGAADGVQGEGRVGAEGARQQLVGGVARGLLQPRRCRAGGCADSAWFGICGMDGELAGGGVSEGMGKVLAVEGDGEDETPLQEPCLGVTPTIRAHDELAKGRGGREEEIVLREHSIKRRRVAEDGEKVEERSVVFEARLESAGFEKEA